MTYSYTLKELPKKYDHKTTEKKWQDHWVAEHTYKWHDDATRDNTYVIDTPPPTVSGLLHMGHVFSYTQCDFVARYQRMKGMDVFYPMGFDDNGLPTERLVEKVKKKRATDYESREAFIAVCDEVAEDARNDFRQLFQSIALSVDWDQEYHTISDEARTISQMSFLDLFHKQEVERKEEPMLWDPVDQTAIAQAETEDKELPSHFNDIYFSIDGSDEKIIIATTRPELIAACVGIFYHPEDARYQHLKGKHAITPIFGVKVPVLEDDSVEIDKGTGIMMCCTFGDEADIEKWRKHSLESRVILNKYGKLTLENADWLPESAAKEAINNKKASNNDKKHPGARQIMLELLEKSGDLKESKPIVHTVKCAERSGAPLEILTTAQWFVKVTDKKDALKARANECNWYPEWMKLRMEQWIDGLSWDWCISRQRYFGVPFPIWYLQEVTEEKFSSSTDGGATVHGTRYHFVGKAKAIIAEKEDLPANPMDHDFTKEFFIRKGYEHIRFDAFDIGARTNEDDYFGNLFTKDNKSYIVVPDNDVMDTWGTSSVSPQVNAGGINAEYCLDADRFGKLFPADLRPQAHEIIRTWAFYTVVKAHLHDNQLPWKDLMISGWCLAEDKTKMSKSKGNVVTPVDLIEEQGTDAVRYWAATSRLGQDTAYSTDLLKIGKKLVTKLWNATKFAAIHLEKLEAEPTTAKADVESGIISETLDQWILTRLQRTVKKSTEAYEKYEYADALRATEDFFWNDFCDNYLELVKKRVYDEQGENPAAQQSAACTIYHCLEGILKLFAPVVPHITEELYAHLFPMKYDATNSLHVRGQWPLADNYPVIVGAEKSGVAAVSILETIRRAKSEKGVSIKYPIDSVRLHTETASEMPTILKPILADVKAAGNVADIEWSDDTDAQDVTLQTEDGLLTSIITFAAEADVA